ncbi:MAG: DUF1572 family protein [Bacteroidota bacterium]
MKENYMESVTKQLEFYKLLGERTFKQLTDDQLFWQFNDESNSIAIIVNHLSGNMKSRWTQFLTSDGEKEWRNREMEFESVIRSREELMDYWTAGWDCVFAALKSVTSENFETQVYIRNQGHSIVEAINRQLAHYAYHMGQVVYIGRMLKGPDWESLSIPKGKSSDYNKEKFSKDKHKAHFTDEYLNENNGAT